MIKIDSTAKVTVNLEGIVIKKPEEPDPTVPDKK
jgi:hypothetical protein